MLTHRAWYGNIVPLWLIVVLICLATHRVTRLITSDGIPLIATPRDAFVQRWGVFSDAKTRENRKTSIGGKPTNGFMRSLAYLWECPWCVSVYVAPVVTYLTWRWTSLGDQHWWFIILVALAASTVTASIAEREPE